MALFKKKIKVTAEQLGKILVSYVAQVSEDHFKKLQELPGLINLSMEDEHNVRVEWDIFVLFSVTVGVQSAIKTKGQEEVILDQLHEQIYKLYAEASGVDVSELDPLKQLFQDRYASYYQVLREYEGGDSMFRLGKQFVDNALSGDESLLEIMMLVPASYVSIAKCTKEAIDEYNIVG